MTKLLYRVVLAVGFSVFGTLFYVCLQSPMIDELRESFDETTKIPYIEYTEDMDYFVDNYYNCTSENIRLQFRQVLTVQRYRWMLEDLEYLINVLTDAGLDYVMLFGTWLAMLRCDYKSILMPWDDDIDVGVYFKNKKTLDALFENDETYRLEWDARLKRYKLWRRDSTGHPAPLDVIALNVTRNLVRDNAVKSWRYLKKWILPVKQVEVAGMYLKVPNNMTAAIIKDYGEDGLQQCQSMTMDHATGLEYYGVVCPCDEVLREFPCQSWTEETWNKNANRGERKKPMARPVVRWDDDWSGDQLARDTIMEA